MKDLPVGLRPREKLQSLGAAALADAELLALLLRTGVRGKGVLQMAQELLHTHGGVAGLLRAAPASLARTKGLGPAKRAELLAVLELARRAMALELTETPLFDAPARVREYLQLQLAHLSHEVFAVLFLDAQNRLIVFEEMFRGTLNQASVYPREIVKRALAHNAAGVVLAHNHPSGVAEPSRADEALTRQLMQSLALVDVRVLDHFVIGREGSVSFAERGLL